METPTPAPGTTAWLRDLSKQFTDETRTGLAFAAKALDEQAADRARLMFLWSLLTDPHGNGFRALWIDHHQSARLVTELGTVLADVDMEEDDGDTEDEEGRTWRVMIDAAKAKLATMTEGPGGFREGPETETDEARIDWIEQMAPDCEGQLLTRLFIPDGKPFREKCDEMMKLNPL